jgi:transcriptional regulator with XRE-family HTH domain
MQRFNADKLRERMKAEKITGRDLAARVGLTNVSISRILNGKQQPSRANAQRIARVFGLEAADFYRPDAPDEPGGFDGRALAAIRTDRGMERAELARRIRRDLQWVQDVESGRVRPDSAQRKRLAEALDVSPDRLKFRPAPDFSPRRLRQLRLQRGVGPHALAAAMAVAPERLLLFEAGEQTPSAGEVQRAEQILGLSPGSLCARQAGAKPASPSPASLLPPGPEDRGEILRRIRQMLQRLTGSQCLQVLAYAQGLSGQRVGARAESSLPAGAAATAAQPQRGFLEVSSHELPEDQDWRPLYVPVIDNIAAGAGAETVEAEEFPPGWAESFVAWPNAPEGSFAVRVRGDSMAPDYCDGDMLIVQPGRQARPGEVSVVVYEDPKQGVRLSRLKRLGIEPDAVVLESINPEYSPVRLDRDRLLRAWPVLDHLPRDPRPAGSQRQVDLSGVRALARRHGGSQSGGSSRPA